MFNEKAFGTSSFFSMTTSSDTVKTSFEILNYIKELNGGEKSIVTDKNLDKEINALITEEDGYNTPSPEYRAKRDSYAIVDMEFKEVENPGTTMAYIGISDEIKRRASKYADKNAQILLLYLGWTFIEIFTLTDKLERKPAIGSMMFVKEDNKIEPLLALAENEIVNKSFGSENPDFVMYVSMTIGYKYVGFDYKYYDLDPIGEIDKQYNLDDNRLEIFKASDSISVMIDIAKG